MKGFKLNNGDIVIENGDIQLISGSELTVQTCTTVLETRKGEWFGNTDEGIDIGFVLGRNVTEDMIRGQILLGLRQVDSTLYIDTFIYNFDKKSRKAIVKFTAKNTKNETISSETIYE